MIVILRGRAVSECGLKPFNDMLNIRKKKKTQQKKKRAAIPASLFFISKDLFIFHGPFCPEQNKQELSAYIQTVSRTLPL